MLRFCFFVLGKKNECPQGKLFDIRDHIQSITNNVPDHQPGSPDNQPGSPDDQPGDDQPGSCPMEANEVSPLPPINTTLLANVIKNLPAGPSCPTPNRDNAPRDTSLSTFQSRKRKMMGDDEFDEYEWETLAHFDMTWLNKIRTHQSDLLPQAEIMENRNWFTYLYNSRDPKKSR